MGAGQRAAAASLPAAGGKILLAQGRKLQALRQVERERGWVAYPAPPRTRMNQLTRRLREDYAALGRAAEKASPALAIDGLETELTTESEPDEQFRFWRRPQSGISYHAGRRSRKQDAP